MAKLFTGNKLETIATQEYVDARGGGASGAETDPVYAADKPLLALKSEVQSVASQLNAPNDGKQYARQNETWVPVVSQDFLTRNQRNIAATSAARHAQKVNDPTVLCLGIISDVHARDLLGGQISSDTNDRAGSSIARAQVCFAQQALASNLSPVDGIFSLGDMIEGNTSPTSERWTTEEALAGNARVFSALEGRKSPFYYLRGNHDNNDRTTINNAVLQKTQYKAICHFDRENNAVRDSQVPDSLYCYADFEQSKIRVIALNYSDYPETFSSSSGHAHYGPFGFGARQVNWLYTEALDLSDKPDIEDWAVLVLCHGRDVTYGQTATPHPNGLNIMGILDAFNKKESFEIISDVDGNFSTSGIADFTTSTAGNVIAYFSGHQHSDDVIYPGVSIGNEPWQNNPYSFTMVFFSAGCQHKDGNSHLVAIDRKANRIHCTAVASEAGIASTSKISGDRDINIIYPISAKGLVFTGTQYIDTQITYAHNARVRAEVMMEPVTGTAAVFGVRANATTNRFILWQNTASGKSCDDFGDESIDIDRSVLPFNKKFVIEKVNRSTYLNDVLFHAHTNNEFSVARPIIVGGYQQSTTSYPSFRGVIYSLKVWRGATLRVDLVPVSVGSTEYSTTPAPSNCFWDTVSEQYFENNGTGAFGIT